MHLKHGTFKINYLTAEESEEAGLCGHCSSVCLSSRCRGTREWESTAAIYVDNVEVRFETVSNTHQYVSIFRYLVFFCISLQLFCVSLWSFCVFVILRSSLVVYLHVWSLLLRPFFGCFAFLCSLFLAFCAHFASLCSHLIDFQTKKNVSSHFKQLLWPLGPCVCALLGLFSNPSMVITHCRSNCFITQE